MQTPDRRRRVSPSRLEISGGDKRFNSCFQNEYQFRILSGHYKQARVLALLYRLYYSLYEA